MKTQHKRRNNDVDFDDADAEDTDNIVDCEQSGRGIIIHNNNKKATYTTNATDSTNSNSSSCSNADVVAVADVDDCYAVRTIVSSIDTTEPSAGDKIFSSNLVRPTGSAAIHPPSIEKGKQNPDSTRKFFITTF